MKEGEVISKKRKRRILGRKTKDQIGSRKKNYT